MKILLVHNSYRQAGGEDVIFEDERRLLQEAGHRVVAYRRSNCEIEASSILERITLAKQAVSATDTCRALAKLLLQEKPEVVHVHNTFMLISPSIYATIKKLGIPTVQTLHNYRLLCPAATFFRDGTVCEECVEHSLWRAIRYGCYRESRPATAVPTLMLAVHRQRGTWTQDVGCYVALTEFARNKFVEGGLPPRKILVKPNFVGPDPTAGCGNGEYAIFVGRLCLEKGVRTLLAAWERLQNRFPLHIVGDGPLRTESEEKVVRHGLSGVCFKGQLPRDQTLRAIKSARLLVLPSECYENFPMSIAEAFACGVPVICSRLGAMQEIVEDGRTGLHFTPGNAEDLAEKINWAWKHPDQMKMMGREARLEYEAKYTAERNYLLLMDIYRRAIDEAGVRPLPASPA